MGPNDLESKLEAELSPSTQQCPSGTFTTPLTLLINHMKIIINYPKYPVTNSVQCTHWILDFKENTSSIP